MQLTIKHLFTAALTAAALGAAVPASGALAGSQPATKTAAVKPSPAGLSKRERANAAAATGVLDGAFNTHEPAKAAARYIDAKTYIQHNPDAPNGREAFVGFVQGYVTQFPQASIEIKRVITQGDLVVVHALAKTAPADLGTVEVDIFRFNAKGKIVEHWDALQPVREETASGNPQV